MCREKQRAANRKWYRENSVEILARQKARRVQLTLDQRQERDRRDWQSIKNSPARLDARNARVAHKEELAAIRARKIIRRFFFGLRGISLHELRHPMFKVYSPRRGWMTEYL